MLLNFLVTTLILLLVTKSDISHKNNIASKKWIEPFTNLLPCLFDHMHCSTPDLPVAHTIRELAILFYCVHVSFIVLIYCVYMSNITRIKKIPH